jgi:hypothetical protein
MRNYILSGALFGAVVVGTHIATGHYPDPLMGVLPFLGIVGAAAVMGWINQRRQRRLARRYGRIEP